MKFDKEVEESLRICDEIQKYIKEGGGPFLESPPEMELDLSEIELLGKMRADQGRTDAGPEEAVEKDAVEPVAAQPVVADSLSDLLPVKEISGGSEKKEEPERVLLDDLALNDSPLDMAPLNGVPLSELSPDEKPLDETPLDEIPLDRIPSPQFAGGKRGRKEKKHLDDTEDISVGKSSSGEEYREKHPLMRVSLNVGICIVIALLLSFVITKFVAYHTSVEGSSMSSTLNSGDQLVVEKMSYRFNDPKRFDIVVFPFNEDTIYIKRIIGLPGETIQIIDGEVYVDGNLLEEPMKFETMDDPGLAEDEIHLGEEEYFVLGDNRNASVDSRRDEVGMVKRSEIQGKAWLRFYPFDDFGKLH